MTKFFSKLLENPLPKNNEAAGEIIVSHSKEFNDLYYEVAGKIDISHENALEHIALLDEMGKKFHDTNDHTLGMENLHNLLEELQKNVAPSLF